jgi:hypothetical protein
MMDGADIAKLLSSKGPVVKCVLLRATPTTTADGLEKMQDSKPKAKAKAQEEQDSKPEAAAADNEEKKDSESEVPQERRVVLFDQMEEIEIDTTPSKSMVQKCLGGAFTFLGQYEDDGIVLMVRKTNQAEMDNDDDDDDDEPFDREEALKDLKSLQLSELHDICRDREIDTVGMLEKDDLINEILEYLESNQPQPLNPHQLQPPLHKAKVRGDILIMKVAATEEELDQQDGQGTPVVIPSNEEFFLDYTKEEYIKFASRTDIVEQDPPAQDEEDNAQEAEDDEEDDDEEEDDEEEGGGAFALGEDEEIAEEDKSAMLNLVMNEVLRQYREDNGRGPDTRELLELRSAIAKQLNVDVLELDAVAADWNKKAKENGNSGDRKVAFSPGVKTGEEEVEDSNGATSSDEPPAKKLKFSPDEEEKESEELESLDQKVEAKVDMTTGDDEQ